mmetsp:Transcript_11913/g.17570  ORF Transcript_11913/g.17570 Transcript_11913/m.17570 type:complete len:106 (-) Transcript_11913:67-384(-)
MPTSHHRTREQPVKSSSSPPPHRVVGTRTNPSSDPASRHAGKQQPRKRSSGNPTKSSSTFPLHSWKKLHQFPTGPGSGQANQHVCLRHTPSPPRDMPNSSLRCAP